MNSLLFFGDEAPSSFPPDRCFTRAEIEGLLNSVKNRTLGEIDKKHIIEKYYAANPDKVTRGTAGDVIEMSVLGCDKAGHSLPKPDILVDEVETEVKTTGVRKPRRKTEYEYEAKEPLTITGVSPAIIINESFEGSRFFHKIERMLMVFYHYILDSTATSTLDYRSFPVLGHLFWQVPSEDLEILKNDWLLVKEFTKNYSFENEVERHKLKSNLMLIDYASPNQPRFRFKRTYVSTIVDAFIKKEKYASLSKPLSKYSEFDEQCRRFTQMYRGKTIEEISKALGVTVNSKDAGQRIVVKMFGGTAKRLNQVKEFSEIGLIAKTVILSPEEGRTEDMKMYSVDFDELLRPGIVFGETPSDCSEGNDYSYMYSYFAEHSFLFIVFQEPYKGAALSSDIFLGFKRYSFTEQFINTEVQRCWSDARSLVFNKELKEVRSGRGYAPNLPKAKDHTVFFKGTGNDGTYKYRLLKKWGYDSLMYIQQIWVKGNYIAEILSQIDYI